MFEGKQLLLATHNRGKVEELEALFNERGIGREISLRSAGDLGLAEPAETESTFVGNARIKAHSAAQASGLITLADDSGLCVDDLGGAPGVYTADWAETPTGRNFDIAMRRVCGELAKAAPKEIWTARFVCTLVLAWPDGYDEVFEGSVHGRIVCPGRGTLGHGYDPIFQPDGYAETFGEMNRWAKNRISHRAAAFEKLLTRFT